MGRSLDWIAAHPWLMTPEALQQVIAIAERTGDPTALATQNGQRLERTRTVQMRDGVAIVPITGPIFRYANLFTEISGATSTQVLATDLREAIDNKFVTRIVLDINSPGGEASGINELANLIYDARGKKTITAYIGGTGASAAYWLASAANQIYADATAVIGSIGVVMSHVDTRKRDARDGVERLEIVSSASPDKRVDPTTESGRAKVQAIVDAMADVFISSVAKYRSTTADNVKKSYGQGGVLVGEQAVRNGMIDGLSSLEAVIANRATPSPNRGTAKPKASGPNGSGATAWDDVIAKVTATQESQLSPAAIYARRRDEERSATTQKSNTTSPEDVYRRRAEQTNGPAAWDDIITKAHQKRM